MPADERRNIPRTKLERLAYIHIEPDNGGIVLNVSGNGLGFHSMNAVERNGPVRFSLQEQNRRIDVCGELVWTDEIQKIGGLRFTTLTTEARAQVRDWMSRPEISADERRSSLGAAVLRAFPGLGRQPVATQAVVGGYLSAARAVLKARAHSKLSGFSGGLVTGLLVSLMTVSLVYLGYSYRHQFGESLIHLGERLAQKPSGTRATMASSQVPASVVPVGQTATPENVVSLPSVPQAQTAEMKSASGILKAPPAKKISEEPIESRLQPPSRDRGKPLLSPEKRVAALTSASSKSQNGALGTPVAENPLHPPVLTSNPPVVSARYPDLPASTPPSSIAPAPDTSEQAPQHLTAAAVQTQTSPLGTASPLQMFFDLGKFKQQSLAQDLSDRVAQLGLRTSVIPRGHLWMNSYQVLVGPYVNEQEEKKINIDLLSHGYKPRPLERGARDFSFRSRVSIERTRLPVGDVGVSWESYLTEAKVKFTHERDLLATANARWIKRPKKYSDNEYVYQNQPDGSRPLVEIHFAGLDRALVFSSIP
ncbi:MAG TPA: PilZ domain-containing protein [Terriglobales bacterium]|jgi:hypothetical protein